MIRALREIWDVLSGRSADERLKRLDRIDDLLRVLGEAQQIGAPPNRW